MMGFMSTINIVLLVILSISELGLAQNFPLVGQDRTLFTIRRRPTIATYPNSKNRRQLLFGEEISYGVIRRRSPPIRRGWIAGRPPPIAIYTSRSMVAQAKTRHGGGRLFPRGNTYCSGIDLLWIMDCSGSINSDAWRKSKDAVKSVTGHFMVHPYSTHVATMTFGTKVKIHRYLQDFSQPINTHIDQLPRCGGLTYLAEALKRSLDVFKHWFDRNPVKNYCVIITDGKANGPGNVKEAARKLRDVNNIDANCETYVIAVGYHFNTRKLAAELTGGDEMKVYLVKDHAELAKTGVLCEGDSRRGL